MRIICPQCQTSFHATEELCKEYGGYVRCGECHAKFNIYNNVEYLNLSVNPANEAEETEVLWGISADTEVENIEIQEDSMFATDNRLDVLVNANNADTTNRVESRPVEESKHKFAETDPIFKERDTEPQLNTPEHKFSDIEKDAGVAEPIFEEPNFSSSVRLNDDNHKLDSNEYDSKWDNDHQGNQAKPRLIRSIITLLWFFLAVFLVGLLTYQWTNLKNNAEESSLKSSMSAIACRMFTCVDKAGSVDLIEISVSRMDEIVEPERQLHITLFVLNKSTTEQSYPNVLITLKRLDGGISGQRVIHSSEYFTVYDNLVNADDQAVKSPLLRIKPGKLEKIVIKFNQPPKGAVGFVAQIVGENLG